MTRKPKGKPESAAEKWVASCVWDYGPGTFGGLRECVIEAPFWYLARDEASRRFQRSPMDIECVSISKRMVTEEEARALGAVPKGGGVCVQLVKKGEVKP